MHTFPAIKWCGGDCCTESSHEKGSPRLPPPRLATALGGNQFRVACATGWPAVASRLRDKVPPLRLYEFAGNNMRRFFPQFHSATKEEDKAEGKPSPISRWLAVSLSKKPTFLRLSLIKLPTYLFASIMAVDRGGECQDTQACRRLQNRMREFGKACCARCALCHRRIQASDLPCDLHSCRAEGELGCL